MNSAITKIGSIAAPIMHLLSHETEIRESLTTEKLSVEGGDISLAQSARLDASEVCIFEVDNFVALGAVHVPALFLHASEKIRVDTADFQIEKSEIIGAVVSLEGAFWICFARFVCFLFVRKLCEFFAADYW